jgi:hypothetical protein
MVRLSGEVCERLLEGQVRAIARIAPQRTVVLFRLVIRRSEQRAIPFPGQRLPVQIVGRGFAALACALATAVLMHDNPAQCRHAARNPERVTDTQF